MTFREMCMTFCDPRLILRPTHCELMQMAFLAVLAKQPRFSLRPSGLRTWIVTSATWNPCAMDRWTVKAKAQVLDIALIKSYQSHWNTRPLIQAQFGLAPLATKTNTHVDGTITTSLGITMYVLDSRTDLQTVDDLQGAIVSSRARPCMLILIVHIYLNQTVFCQLDPLEF